MKKIEIFWFVKLFLAQNFLSNKNKKIKWLFTYFFKLKCVVMLTKISLKSFFHSDIIFGNKNYFFY